MVRLNEKVEKFVPTLFALRDGASKYARVARGKPSISKLQSSGLFMLDTGFEIFIWSGKGAPKSAKVNCLPFALW